MTCNTQSNPSRVQHHGSSGECYGFGNKPHYGMVEKSSISTYVNEEAKLLEELIKQNVMRMKSKKCVQIGAVTNKHMNKPMFLFKFNDENTLMIPLASGVSFVYNGQCITHRQSYV